jgi:hypothetical protein
VRVPHADAVATAALRSLLAGPPAGYETALPDDVRARVLGIADAAATLDLSPALDDRANAQLVYTLTQFRTIRGVGYPGMEDPDVHEATDHPLKRSDFVRFAPPILVESPLPHDQVATPVHVSGTASVYEATLFVELVQNGTVLTKKLVTASSGAPYTGTFETTLAGGETGPATVVAFAPNAANGAEQHRIEVPVTLTP